LRFIFGSLVDLGKSLVGTSIALCWTFNKAHCITYTCRCCPHSALTASTYSPESMVARFHKR
jgi:hypothetical protein